MGSVAIIGVMVVVMACVGALLLVRQRHGDAQQIQIKAVLFGLYFWGLIFLQLIICALAYTYLKA